MTTPSQSNASIVAIQTISLRSKVNFFGSVFVVERHGDELKVNGKKVVLHHADCQKSDSYDGFHQVRKELRGKPTPPFGMFEFLLKQPEFLPESWKICEGKHRLPTQISFLETLDETRFPFVKHIYWHEGNNRWETGQSWDDQRHGGPVALLESSVS